MKKLLLFFCLSFFAFGMSSAQEAPRQAIIIDTDMAIDDWLAILYLLRHPNVEVKAITLAGTGEAHCHPGLENIQGLLALANQPNIPIACGRETPLGSEHTFPLDWRERVDSMLGIELPENSNPLPDISAVDLLAETASTQTVTLVTLGTLTNIAEFVQAYPELIPQIPMTYIMGGAVNVEGNLYGFDPTGENFSAEWNIYVDPHAAQIVIESGLEITLVPLDATRFAPVTMAFLRQLETNRSTPEAEFIYQSLLAQTDFIQSGSYYFWDPLTAVLATDESFATILGRPIYVITEEGTESGRTVASSEGTRVRVVSNVDKNAFERIFLNVINGQAPDTPAPIPSSIAVGGEANAALVQRYYQAWSDGDFAVFDEILTPDFLQYVNNGLYPSDSATLKETAQLLRSAMPDLSLSLSEIIVLENVAAVRFTLSGTHTGQFLALAPSGNSVSVQVQAILHFDNNRIKDEWWTFDSLELFYQLGAISPDALSPIYGE